MWQSTLMFVSFIDSISSQSHTFTSTGPNHHHPALNANVPGRSDCDNTCWAVHIIGKPAQRHAQHCHKSPHSASGGMILARSRSYSWFHTTHLNRPRPSRHSLTASSSSNTILISSAAPHSLLGRCPVNQSNKHHERAESRPTNTNAPACQTQLDQSTIHSCPENTRQSHTQRKELNQS
jgi:hypothetical protein